MTYRYRLRRLRKVIGGERDGEGHGARETPRRSDRVDPLRRETAEPRGAERSAGRVLFTVEARRGTSPWTTQESSRSAGAGRLDVTQAVVPAGLALMSGRASPRGRPRSSDARQAGESAPTIRGPEPLGRARGEKHGRRCDPPPWTRFQVAALLPGARTRQAGAGPGRHPVRHCARASAGACWPCDGHPSPSVRRLPLRDEAAAARGTKHHSDSDLG